MQQYLLYSTSIHLLFFLLLFYLFSPAPKNLAKHYYIDFIGPSRIETVQNNTNTMDEVTKKEKNSPAKTTSVVQFSQNENFDKDSFFKDLTPPKPSLASQTPQIFSQSTNKVKEESFVSGGINTDSDFPYPWYITQLREILWEAWVKRMPTSRELKCIIKFRIMRNGNIKNTEIEKSSGNRLFDHAAFSAVESVEKFPALPDDFFEDSLTIHVEFKNTISQ